MLLVANIGNSEIELGIFKNDESTLVSSFNISSDTRKTADEYLVLLDAMMSANGIDKNDISGAIISSVVPTLTCKIKNVIDAYCVCEALVVGPGVRTGFHIKIDSPSELGGDIVANTAAAIRIKNKNHCLIVADIGDINTISAIGKDGEYLGCVIFPGITLDIKTLYNEAAQLPTVNFSGTCKAIGKNSRDSICSGVMYSNALAVDGIVEKFIDEMGCARDAVDLVATGENAENVLKICRSCFVREDKLTLKGLWCIYENTTRSR